MEHFDAKVNHILEMITSIQQQLQMQEMTKEEGNGDDFLAMESYSISEKTNIFVHESDFLTKETIEVEEHKLFDETHATEIKVVDMSEIGEIKLETEMEENEVRERFVEVLNHTLITTIVSKSRFEESKSDVLVDLQLEESNSEFEVLPKLSFVVSLRSATIESSKNNYAWKVFDELIRRDLNPLKAVSVFLDLGKEIYIYMEENIVKNEPMPATLVVYLEMKGIEGIMSFDPGGDSKVFDSYKLFYIDELALLQNCSNSPRSIYFLFCLIFGKWMHTHMEMSGRLIIVFVGSDWVESYMILLNIIGAAMVFDVNSLISEARHYEIYTPRVCEIGFFLKIGGVKVEASRGHGVTSTGITHEGGDVLNRELFDALLCLHIKYGGNFGLQNDICSMEEEYLLENCCIEYAGVGFAESIIDLEYVSSECLQTPVTDGPVLTRASINSPWKATLFRIMNVPECKNEVVCLKNSEFCEIASSHYEPEIWVGNKALKTYGNFGNLHDILSHSFDDMPSNDMDLFMKVLDVIKTSRTALVDNLLDVVTESLTSVGKMNHLPSLRRKNQIVVLSFIEPNSISGAIVVHSFEKKSDKIIMSFNPEDISLVLAVFAKGLAYGLPEFGGDRFLKLIGIDVRNQIDVGVVMQDIDENSQTYKVENVFVGMVDDIFFNVAHHDQIRIFVLNASYFLKVEGLFVLSVKANYIDSIVLVEAVFMAEVKKLQVEHFKSTEMVTLEPFEGDHGCGWIKMFDRPLPKPPPRFRYLSHEDTTHLKGEYCCGNGGILVWRFGRGGAIVGAEVGSREASWLGHFNKCFQNLFREVSSPANILMLLHLNLCGNLIVENLGSRRWECLKEFIIPTTLKDDISNLVRFELHGIVGALLKLLFHEFCAGAMWSFLMTYRLDGVEMIDEPQVSYVTDELDSPLLHTAASNFRIPHFLCLSDKLRSVASYSLLIPKKKKNVQRGVHG